MNKKVLFIFGFIDAFIGMCVLIRGVQLFISGTGFLLTLQFLFLASSLIMVLPMVLKRKNEGQILFILSVITYVISSGLQCVAQIIAEDNIIYIISFALSVICACITFIFVKDLENKSRIISRLIILTGVFRVISIVASDYSYLGGLIKNEGMYSENNILLIIPSSLIVALTCVAYVLYFYTIGKNDEDAREL